MKTQNKVLALIDIMQPLETMIESSINLAETYQAELRFFYVKKKTDAMRTENQVAVVRSLVEQQRAIEKFRNTLARFQKRTSVKLNYAFAEGRVKKSIKSEIDTYGPDLMILGKRLPNGYRILGNQVTELVLNSFDGPLLITHPSKVLEIRENLSVGVLNDAKVVAENNLTSSLLKQSKEPLKLFKIADESEFDMVTRENITNTIDFTFENNENVVDSLTRYVHQNNVHLFCLDRPKKANNYKNVKLKKFLKRINTSMLMFGNENTQNLINA